MMQKFAIVAQPQKSDPGRALHSLLYARQLHDAGHDVRVYYDGEGTWWIGQFEDPEYPYHDVYNAVQDAGLIAGACRYCADQFGATDEVESSGVDFIDDDDGHPSIARMVEEGRAIITL
jgi:hypothetical protein